MAASSDDSQASVSQLLAKFIESDAEQNLQTSEQSIDSFKPNPVPPPCYHTNGLPLLQCESEGSSGRDECELQEGSQKESKSSKAWLSQSVTKRTTNVTSPLVATKNSVIHKGSHPGDQEKKLFKSPLPHARKRASSRDSLIGTTSDPATAYISNSRHFQMSLSQFDDSTTSQENVGTILVEGTPDPSGGHHQEYEEDERMSCGQPRDVYDAEDVADIAEASQASSHSDALAFWTGEATRGTVYEQATQPETQSATQPETQSTHPENSSQAKLDVEWDDLVERTGWKIDVPRGKRARYIAQLRVRARNQGDSEPTTLDNTKNFEREEDVVTQEATQVQTQLDDEDSIYRPPRRQLPAPKRRHPTPPVADDSEPTQVVVDEPIQWNKRRQLPAPKRKVTSPFPAAVEAADDTMVVPDSEPPSTSPPLPAEQANNDHEEVVHQGNKATDIVSESEAARLTSLDPLTSDDEEEDDVPLATKTHGKGEMKKETSAQRMPPPPTVVAQTRRKAKGNGESIGTPTPEPTTARRSSRRAPSSGVKESEIVPSLIPTETPQPKKARSKGARKSSTKRRGPGSSAKRRRTKYKDDDSTVEENSTKEEEDVMTEIGLEDEGTETGSLKRKRPTRGTYDTVASGSGVKSSQTPRGRNTRSVQGDLQVFALSKADGHYFAGRLLHRDSSGNCFVEFRDRSTALLQLDQIRRLELRLGDEVLWEEEMVGWTVTGFHLDSKGQHQVTTELYGTKTCHRLEEIRITACSIISQWEDRKLNPASAMILSLPIRDDGSVKPSTSAVKPSAEKPRPTQFLREFAIIGTHINEQTLRELSVTGARNTSHWTDVINFGEHREERRWRLLREESGKVQSRNLEGISRIFMVANAPYATPKYLMALALGVPCVSLAWLTEMAVEGSVKDWSQYLLPQGYSEYLGLRTSQLVDMDWGNSADHIVRIMDNLAPAKLFKGLNILCITEDDDYPMDAKISQLPPIILAMGAELVEVVDHIDDRSEFICPSKKSMFVPPGKVEKLKKEGKEVQPLNFDLAVYLKRCLGEAPQLPGIRAQTWGWVKESLIASRLLPDSLDKPANPMES